MKFIKVADGYLNPRTIELLSIETKQYGWTDFARNEDGSPKRIDGHVVYGPHMYYDYIAVMATLSGGSSVALEAWDSRVNPEIDTQERLDHWLSVLEEALG